MAQKPKFGKKFTQMKTLLVIGGTVQKDRNSGVARGLGQGGQKLVKGGSLAKHSEKKFRNDGEPGWLYWLKKRKHPKKTTAY